jgi:hypothetical protein
MREKTSHSHATVPLRLSSTLWVTSIYLVISAFNLVGVILPQAGDFVWLSYKVRSLRTRNVTVTRVFCMYSFLEQLERIGLFLAI